MRRMIWMWAVTMVGLVGCTGGHTVKQSERNRAKAQFEQLEDNYKALQQKMSGRMKRAFQVRQGVKQRWRYAIHRQILLKYRTETKELATSYVRIATSNPPNKHPHQWTYASFYRGAQLLESNSHYAARMKRYWTQKGQRRRALYFHKLKESYQKAVYSDYLRILFLSDYFHMKDAAASAHTQSGNPWLKRTQRRRCRLARILRMSRITHQNVSSNIFRGRTAAFGGRTKTYALIRAFRNKGSLHHCGS